MEYEIKQNKEKLIIKRKDELENGEFANSSIEVDKNGINLQIQRHHRQP